VKLDGKIALVTGAGRGIGREIALACAAEGADVVLAARSVEALVEVAEEITNTGRDAQAIETDVTDRASVESMVGQALDRWGRIDLLVNNSGIAGPSSPSWEVRPDEWDETIAVNLTGVFSCCQVVLPSMIERRSGAIVNIGSVTGKRPLLNRSPYAASKAALIGLTRTMAEEVGPHNVRVNLISPGTVEGDRIDWVFEQQAKALGSDADDVRSQFVKSTPLRRLVSARDVANAVTFLGSDESAGITGADLNVTSGLVMY